MYGFRSLLTDGCDELIKVAVWEKRLRKLPEKQLQCSGDDVNVLPLTILQVQFLCLNTTGAQPIKAQQGALLSTVTANPSMHYEPSAFPVWRATD